MTGLETRADWEALAMDAARVQQAALTLTWFLRGMVSGAETDKARDVAVRALGVAEGMGARADVVYAAVAHARDEAAAIEEQGRQVD